MVEDIPLRQDAVIPRSQRAARDAVDAPLAGSKNIAVFRMAPIEASPYGSHLSSAKSFGRFTITPTAYRADR